MKRVLGITVFLSALAWAPRPAHAQLEFAGDAPRVFSIQERPYRLGHEFQLGLGVLPMDAFYVGAVIGASYTYHFSDFWGWEIAGAGYSLNFDTGLKNQLRSDYLIEPVGGGGERVRLFGSTGVVVKPLFGKLTLFNQTIVHAETFFTAGLGSVLKRPQAGEGANNGGYRFAVNLGMGFRFWTTRAVSWRLDIRDYFVFEQALPENMLFVMLSASLNYFNPTEHDP